MNREAHVQVRISTVPEGFLGRVALGAALGLGMFLGMSIGIGIAAVAVDLVRFAGL